MALGTSLQNLFGKSPIDPIQQHMKKVLECSQSLVDFFEAVYGNDWKKAEKAQQKISLLEREADAMKKELRLNLPKSLFLPVPRTDLLELITMQDKIANRAKDVAGLMLGRKMEIPQSLQSIMTDYVSTSIATAAGALKAIQELDELLETGFGGKEVKFVEKLIKELDKLENKNDQQQIKIRAKLFKIEDDLPPVKVMFLYNIIDLIGELADHAQKVGSRLQLLLAK